MLRLRSRLTAPSRPASPPPHNPAQAPAPLRVRFAGVETRPLAGAVTALDDDRTPLVQQDRHGRRTVDAVVVGRDLNPVGWRRSTGSRIGILLPDRDVAGGTLLLGRDALHAVGRWQRAPRSVDQRLLDDVLLQGGRVHRTHGHATCCAGTATGTPGARRPTTSCARPSDAGRGSRSRPRVSRSRGRGRWSADVSGCRASGGSGGRVVDGTATGGPTRASCRASCRASTRASTPRPMGGSVTGDSVTGDELDVSIVLPVHDEEGHLPQELHRIRRSMDASELSYEIIVVDDGSTDRSAELAREAGGVRLVTLRDNRGTGAARRAGTSVARGAVVVWTDVDMTYPNDRIPELVAELDGHDQVVGARTTEEGTLKAVRVPAKLAIRKLASYLTETRIPDLNSGFRAFRRDVGRQFVHELPDGFSCVTTITLAFLSNGYSVRYVPIPYAPRAGSSKFHWWSDTKRYLRQVVRMALSYNPLRVFMPIGLLLLLIACGKLAYDWSVRDFALAANTLLLFLAAFQVLTTGLLADLVARGQRHGDLVPSARQHVEGLPRPGARDRPPVRAVGDLEEQA